MIFDVAKVRKFWKKCKKMAKKIAIFSLACSGQGAGESQREVECAMRRLCAFDGWRGMLGELPPSTKPMESNEMRG